MSQKDWLIDWRTDGRTHTHINARAHTHTQSLSQSISQNIIRLRISRSLVYSTWRSYNLFTYVAIYLFTCQSLCRPISISPVIYLVVSLTLSRILCSPSGTMPFVPQFSLPINCAFFPKWEKEKCIKLKLATGNINPKRTNPEIANFVREAILVRVV